MISGLPERTIEMAEAIAARHKTLVLEPGVIQDIVVIALGMHLVIAGLGQKVDLPQSAILILCEPALMLMHHMGITDEERRVLAAALVEDLKEIMP